MRVQDANSPSKSDPPRLLTARAAAACLAIAERTLWSLANRGEIPAVRIGRAVRYDPADLAAFVARQKTGLQG